MRAALLGLALCLVACDDKTGTAVGNPPRADLFIELTDAPGDVASVFVDLVEIAVHRSGGAPVDAAAADGGATDDGSGWTVVTTPMQSIDLLAFRDGAVVSLGGTALPEGRYDMIRLVVTGGEVVEMSGQRFPLKIPSGEQSGLKIRHDLELLAEVSTTLVLDFDGQASLNMTPQGYTLRPVLSVKERRDTPRPTRGRPADAGTTPSSPEGPVRPIPDRPDAGA